MKINTHELSTLVQEASTLADKPALNQREKRRFSFLQTAIAAVRSGASLAEVDQQDLNERERAAGLRQTRLPRRDEEKRAKAIFMQEIVKGGFGEARVQGGYEFRAETEGNVISQIGTYSGLGSFVPTDFFAEVKSSLLEHDCLFDEDTVTLIESTNGRLLRLGNYDDSASEAQLVAEAALSGFDTNLGNPNQSVLAAFSYCTKVHPFSLEIFDDLDQSYGAYQLFERFASDRMARGIGNILLTGNGSNQTTGLITALEALGVSYVTATGSAVNDGSSATGANSLGSQDFANLWGSVNRQYRESSRACWVMNDSTLTAVSAVVTKYGLPLVNFENGTAYILNKPVKISPSMPSVGSKNIPVLFGDLSFWFTRLVTDDKTRIRVIKEAPGLIENGQIGLQMFMRADGVLNFKGAAANTPINYIVNHS
jgi:HK97 family phage major capsid protein